MWGLFTSAHEAAIKVGQQQPEAGHQRSLPQLAATLKRPLRYLWKVSCFSVVRGRLHRCALLLQESVLCERICNLLRVTALLEWFLGGLEKVWKWLSRGGCVYFSSGQVSCPIVGGGHEGICEWVCFMVEMWFFMPFEPQFGFPQGFHHWNSSTCLEQCSLLITDAALWTVSRVSLVHFAWTLFCSGPPLFF